MFKGPGKPGLRVATLHRLKLAHFIRGIFPQQLLSYLINPCIKPNNPQHKQDV